MPLNDDLQATGLRERKKAKTRAAIQREALRLFGRQGYAATTVEQIAAAAEVSPSTFFRYFPSKEDVVLYDVLDPALIAAFRAQPPELSPIQALRAAFVNVFKSLPAEELAQQRERAALFLSVPELRAAWIGELGETILLMEELIAERLGRRADDSAVRNFAGAVLGVALVAVLYGMRDPKTDLFDSMDAGFAYLEAGLPLERPST
ncbi:MAG: TetR family transcriptional regulator [Dehalococcoidia bacterium]|jgi:AcrR family transcriptional regulator